MTVRRLLRRALFPAAVVLPLWLMIGSGVFASPAATALGIVVAAPVLFAAMVAVAALIAVRGSVRASRAVSWRDAPVLILWWAAAALSPLPLPGSGWYAVAVVVFGLVAFWVSVWQLWTEARARLAGVSASLARERAGAAPAASPESTPPVFIVREKPAQGEHP